MYGHFHIVLRNFIIETQGGEQVWEKIVSQAKCESDYDMSCVYDDSLVDKIIKLAIDILGFPREPLLMMLGEYYLNFLRQRGYDEMLRNLGSNILEFLQNLDSVHGLAKRDFPDMVAPSFRCDEDSVSDRMVLHYYSARKGFHPIVKGLTVEAAKAFYKMQLQMDLVSVETENVAEEKGEREHVTFNIIAKKIKEQVVSEGPPTFIAQTKKHSEKQILQEDVEAVRKKLEQIKDQLGEGALPLTKKRSAKAKWRIAAKITAMHKGFVPNYPQISPINPRMFIEICPYHLIIDAEMKIVQSGIKIQMMMPNIRNRHATVTNYFTIRYPNCVDLSFENIQRFVQSPFVLEMRKEEMEKDWTERPPIQIKGHMYLLRDNGYYAYMASPVASSWSDLEHRTMKLADIPMWDITRDFLVADQEYRRFVEQSIRNNMAGNPHDRGLSAFSARRGSAADDPVVKEKIARIQKDLDIERQRCNTMYLSYLPKEAVDLVHRGLIPSGEFYTQVTAMFCDVVHFLPMVAKCSPDEVVGILDSLQCIFDKITKAQNTYRVESIGDAFLVIAGIGENDESHAERVANTALDVLIASRQVKSPLDGDTIQLRFGIHTGSMVAGVLGDSIPRFVVMGETSIVASKLESHSDPGKIQISPTTYAALENKPFAFEERGEIELRGYGPLKTYFLMRKETAPKDVPALNEGNAEVTYINEGKLETPFAKTNKIHPANESPSSGVGSRPPTGESEVAQFQ